MAECAALLVDDVLPHEPIRQWVLSFPYPLRFLFASRPAVMRRVLGIVYRTIAKHLIRKAGYKTGSAHTGAVTLRPQIKVAIGREPPATLSHASLVAVREFKYYVHVSVHEGIGR